MMSGLIITRGPRASYEGFQILVLAKQDVSADVFVEGGA